MPQDLLTFSNLTVDFGKVRAVAGVSLSVARGEVVGIVGETGSGKSVTMLAVLGLIDASGNVQADEMHFAGHDLLRLSPRERRALMGKEMAIVFQDATGSLNPAYTIGAQLQEVLREHEGLRGARCKARALELLDQVGIADAKNRFYSFPHQLSGGMNQRVMIAMAIACKPKLLIADEPTTALDVTTQAQIMELLLDLQKKHGMALVLISHDLAVVAEVAQRVVVMYAGEVIETNHAPTIFDAPHHPYTEALLAAIPEHNRGAERLAALPGRVPSPAELRSDALKGCWFAPRCAYVEEACRQAHPQLDPVILPTAALHDNKHANSEDATHGMPEINRAKARCIKPLHKKEEVKKVRFLPKSNSDQHMDIVSSQSEQSTGVPL